MSTRAKLLTAGGVLLLLVGAGTLILLGASLSGHPAATATATAAAPSTPAAATPSAPATSSSPPPGGQPADALSPAPLPATTVPYTDAARVAQEALFAYANKLTTEKEWWAHLQPYLSEQAQQDYARTDPTLVPIHAINGPPVQASGVSQYLATVAFTTDDGPWTVQLSRRLTDGTWAVDRFVRG